MARSRPKQNAALATQVAAWMIEAIRRNPRRNLPIVLAGLIAVGLLYWWANRPAPVESSPAYTAGKPGEFLLCFWNVENLFDDRDDQRLTVDEPYDNWFARDVAARSLKLRRLTEALLRLNGGKGPDIIAGCEIESLRAAELLRDSLNESLADANWHYRYVVLKEVSAGRHIAPCVISRLPLREGRTKLVGVRQRILETEIELNGHALTVIVSHWTSRRNDHDGAEARRERYGEAIYNRYRDLAIRDPDVDLLVCGDFNDTPQDGSVRMALRATGDLAEMTPDAIEPKLLNLFAGKDPARFGTHYYSKLNIFDQIVVSRGLLDARGWACLLESVATVNGLVRPGGRTRAPWRFGNESDTTFERGYSDHFPVTVRLRVQGN